MKALLALGFRPFYLLAGLYAALGVPLWALQYASWLPHANALWHAHEMLFGYAFAVIAGFLFTAVRNWTGRPTPSGWTLGGVAVLWIAARLAAPVSLPLASLLDAAFAAAVAWVSAGRFWQAATATGSSSCSCSRSARRAARFSPGRTLRSLWDSTSSSSSLR